MVSTAGFELIKIDESQLRNDGAAGILKGYYANKSMSSTLLI